MDKKVFTLFVLVLVAQCVVSRQNQRKKNRVTGPRKMGNLEDLMNLYDPTFLAVVWPQITVGVHLYVDSQCEDDLTLFFAQLKLGRAWAYSVADASGRYGSGLFKGNRYWLGSKQECLQLDHKYRSKSVNETFEDFRISSDYLHVVLRREKNFHDNDDSGPTSWRSLIQKDELIRRLVQADRCPPYSLSYYTVQVSLNITKITLAQAHSVTLGVCLPRSCSLEDVASLVNFSILFNDNLKSNKSIPRIVKVTSARRVEDFYDIKNDLGGLILICVTIALIMTALTATAVDFNLITCKTHNSKSMSFDLQKVNNTNSDVDNKQQILKNKHHKCDYGTKESNIVDMQTLTINNINNSNNINLITAKKVMKPNVLPPSITLDVVSMERVTGSCKRCGKYKKQCNNINPKHLENLPACPRVKSFASITTEVRKKESLFKSLVLCFSLKRSWKRLLNTNMANKDLSVLHILRIVATFWVIFVHVAMIANYISDNADDVNDRNNIYYIVMTGTLAFDTLFFVSGLFSAHHFFFLKGQYTIEELVSFGGPIGQILQFVCFVINRAIRLLPSYTYVIFLSAVLSRITRATSVLQLPESDYTTCNTYWWRNLLYVTTFFDKGEQCLQVSWYLSVETQLHLLGVLACTVYGASRKLVSAVCAGAIVICVASDVGAAFTYGGQFLTNIYSSYFTFIERPLARVSPYFFGMLAGWLVIHLEGKLHMSKSKSSLLWLWSLFGVVFSLVTPWTLPEWSMSWVHPVWPLALFWPALVSATLFAASTRYLLESPLLAALSRLCCNTLLLHGPVARALMLSTNTVLCDQIVCIWWYYVGTSVVTLLASLLLSLLIETPCCSLLRKLSDYANW